MASVTVKLNYGGDWPRWLTEVVNMLHKKGLLIDEISDVQLQRKLNDYSKERERSLQAALAICNQVEVGLLARVPAEDHLDASALLSHLQRIAQPFRLLDLPAELRVRIFEMHFAETAKDESYTVLAAFDQPAEARSLPALTQISRQIRAESLPVFMATNCLQFVFSDCMDEDLAKAMNKAICCWAEHSAKSYFKYIRSIQVEIYGWVDCTISYTNQQGLKVILENSKSGPAAFVPEKKVLEAKQEQLGKYIETIEAERKVLDLKGESIILALIRDPNVWIWQGDWMFD